MPLGPRASAGDWIHDFHRSSAPQFRGKSQAERTRMALGAYYANRRARGGLTNPPRFQSGGLFGGGDNLFTNSGVESSPGGMPAGGYQYNNPNFGNFGSNFPPGNTPAEGTGFPVTAPPLPEGSQVLPNWVSPYGPTYGTSAYTPPPPSADPIGDLYGKSTGYQKMLNLSPQDMQQFLAQPAFKGDPNDPTAILDYISKFPTAVQNQMKPGGSMWSVIHNPDLTPATWGKGYVTSDVNPWARTPEQTLAFGQQSMGHINPNIQGQFAKWFNQAQAPQLGGLSLSAPQPQMSAMKQAALARAQAMPQVRRGPGYTSFDPSMTDWAGRLRALDQPLGPFGTGANLPGPTPTPSPFPPVRRRGGLV